MAAIRIGNVEVFVADKQKLVFDRIRESPPMIVVSNDDGVYVFADRIGKVHSTILLAGTGNSFSGIETWFRGQISDLVRGWGPNVPKVKSEARLLPPVFQSNLLPNEYLVYADLILVEMEKEPEHDLVIRVDFLGQETRRVGGGVHFFSHRIEPARDNIDESDEERKERKEEEERAVSKELQALGLANKDDLRDDDQLRRAIDHYPGRVVFLNRAKLKSKQFHWVYESIK